MHQFVGEEKLSVRRDHHDLYFVGEFLGDDFVDEQRGAIEEVGFTLHAFRVGGGEELDAAGFGIVSLLLQVFVPYDRYVRVLKWLTLSLFAYVAAAFFVQISWTQVAHATFLPKLTWNKGYLTGLVAVLGTTISPYLFFWQASQEVEEVKNHRGEKALKRAPANGWSRYGLAELYKARGNAAQAKKMEEELAKTWNGDRAQLQLSRL